jgi:hypothetical protein
MFASEMPRSGKIMRLYYGGGYCFLSVLLATFAGFREAELFYFSRWMICYCNFP